MRARLQAGTAAYGRGGRHATDTAPGREGGGTGATDKIGGPRQSKANTDVDGDEALRNVFPKLHLGWTREHCQSYLESRGRTGIAKSAGLSQHLSWIWLRDNDGSTPLSVVHGL